jgi:hypothetical protein
MTFRYVVRCVALVAVALVGAGCSSGGLPAPSSAGTQGPAGPQGAGAAGGRTGTVTVRSGGKVVCVMTLKDGKGSCKVSTKDYKPGTVSFTGTYTGDDGLKASQSASVSLHILKAPKAK